MIDGKRASISIRIGDTALTVRSLLGRWIEHCRVPPG